MVDVNIYNRIIDTLSNWFYSKVLYSQSSIFFSSCSKISFTHIYIVYPQGLLIIMQINVTTHLMQCFSNYKDQSVSIGRLWCNSKKVYYRYIAE